MDKRLSVKISIISFLLLVHVVIGHSVNVDYVEGADNTVWFIENFISSRLVKVIIPLFFFISAYLFFMNITPGKNDQLSVFAEKISKRLRTIGIPYLFWCTFWFVVIYILQSIPALSQFFPTPFSSMSVWKQFWSLYIEPVNYPFWFLRELLLYVLITPLLYWLVRNLKWFVMVVFFVISLFYFGIRVIEIDIYRFHMLVYYCLGIYCAINKVNLSLKFNLAVQILLLLIGFGLCALLIWFDVNQIEETWQVKLISNITTAVGFVSVWSLYDYLDDRIHFKYHQIYSYGFIIYAAHGLPILWLKEALVKFFQPGPIGLLVFYVMSFTAIILSCIGFGILLKKFLPKVYLFTTGNR